MDLRLDSLTLEAPSRELSYEQQQRVLNEEYYRNMATTPQLAADRISKIDGKSEIVADSMEPSFLRDESFRERERLKQETINQRDLGAAL